MKEGFTFNAPPSQEVKTESFHERLVEGIDRDSRSLDKETARHGWSSHDPEKRKAYRERFHVKEKKGSINGQDFSFLGVAHTPETLLFEREKLEDAIKNCGAVVLECAPEIAGLFNPEFQKKIHEELMAVLKDKVEVAVWIATNITKNPTKIFFHEMEQLAKKYGKPVITIDPHSGPNIHKDLMREWISESDVLREKTEAIQTGMVGGLSAGVLASLGFLTLSIMEGERGKNVILQEQEQLKNLEDEAEARQQEITKLTESVEETRTKLNEIRGQFGLPPIKEDPPSVFSAKDKLEKLQAEQEGLEKQKEELISKQEKEQQVRSVVATKEDAPENPSRRNFLKGVAVLGITAVVAPTAILSVLEQKPERAGGDKPLVASLLFDEIDYRNVAVARGIDLLTQREKYKGPLVIIYGRYHTDPMVNYLNSPTLRNVKYAAYKPLRNIKPPQIGEHRYSMDKIAPFNTNPTGRWERIRAEDI